MEVLRLKEIMKAKGVSREQLAEMVGVSKTTISNISGADIEKGLPTIKLLLQLAEKLDVDIRDMFVPTKESNIEEARQLIEQGLDKLK
jgi:transcriptional regulator with XRE-family HTH domain